MGRTFQLAIPCAFVIQLFFSVQTAAKRSDKDGKIEQVQQHEIQRNAQRPMTMIFSEVLGRKYYLHVQKCQIYNLDFCLLMIDFLLARMSCNDCIKIVLTGLNSGRSSSPCEDTSHVDYLPEVCPFQMPELFALAACSDLGSFFHAKQLRYVLM